MRFLFDLGHPAHYYLFKHSMRLLRDAGHEVILIARQKDCLPDLIRSGGWPCHLIPRKKRNLAALGVETLRGIGLAVSISSRRAVDLRIGTSMVVGPAARLAGAISLVFEEDNAAGVPLTLWPPISEAMPLAWLWCGLLLAGGLVCLHPRVFSSAANLALRKMGRPALIMPRAMRYVLPLTGSLVQLVLQGIGTWLLARAITEVPLGTVPLFISAAALGQTLGFVAVFAPAGLGVREGILLLIFNPLLGVDKAAVVVVASRVVVTLADVVTAAVGYVSIRAAKAGRDGAIDSGGGE